MFSSSAVLLALFVSFSFICADGSSITTTVATSQSFEQLTSTIQINCCPLISPLFCSCKSEVRIECSNFTHLNQLSFETTTTTSSTASQFNFIKLRPLFANVTLNNDLNLSGLRIKQLHRFRLHLLNFNSFELTANPFMAIKQLNNNNENHHPPFNSLLIDNSSFLFLYRNKTFDWYCDLLYNDNKIRPIFSMFKFVYLGFVTQNAYENISICPIVFKNAKIESLFLSNLTLLNRPSFIRISTENVSTESSRNSRLNSSIKNLHIQSSLVKLDSSLLDRNVFEHVQKISIEFSNLSAIDEHDLFKSFTNLKEIRLWLLNFEAFWHSSREHVWLAWVNWNRTSLEYADLSTSLITEYYQYNSANSELYIEMSDERNIYKYPDRDFCLFKYFPHENRVFPIIKSSQGLNCTCTILYLVQNWKYTLTRTIRTSAVTDCFRHGLKHFNHMVSSCNFKQKLKKCFANSDRTIQTAYPENLKRKLSLLNLSSSSALVQSSHAVFLISILINRLYL